MITFDPPISTCLLQAVTPGSIIRTREGIGFCVFNPSDPQQSRMFVSLQGEPSTFVFSLPAETETVLSFGSDLIVLPTFDTYDAELVRSRDSKGELFMVDGVPKVIVHLPDRTIRLLDLNSGALTPVTNIRNATGFLEWAVGVATKRDKFTQLISVGRPHGAEFDA
jgi:hypothetical protein